MLKCVDGIIHAIQIHGVYFVPMVLPHWLYGGMEVLAFHSMCVRGGGLCAETSPIGRLTDAMRHHLSHLIIGGHGDALWVVCDAQAHCWVVGALHNQGRHWN